MTSAVALPHTPTRLGQGTAIEQSRAAAEVFASVMAADAKPRDVQASIKAMKDACGMRELAERAFFRFPRSGQPLTGPSVYLARELARCWGNVQYGVSELRRDDEHGQSEMQAFAWDLESNARVSAIFIVPHKRDKRGGPEALTDMRDIYENNANAGARRVREALFSVLPLWFVEQAKALCTKTLEHGGGKPLPQRIAAAIEAFGELGVSERQLAARVGRPSSAWTALDLAPLTIVHGSITRGEVSRDEEFPPEVVTVTAADIAPPAGPAAPAEVPAAQVPAAAEPPDEAPAAAPPAGDAAPAPMGAEPAPAAAGGRPALAAQKKRIGILASEAKLDDPGRFAFVLAVTGRTVTSTNDLTTREAAEVIARFEELRRAEDFPAAVEEVLRLDDQRRMEAELADEAGS